MSALDDEGEVHPVAGALQLIVDLSSGVRACVPIDGAKKLQQRLWFAIGEAEQGRLCRLVSPP